jgi:hypothetical protein
MGLGDGYGCRQTPPEGPPGRPNGQACAPCRRSHEPAGIWPRRGPVAPSLTSAGPSPGRARPRAGRPVTGAIGNALKTLVERGKVTCTTPARAASPPPQAFPQGREQPAPTAPAPRPPRPSTPSHDGEPLTDERRCAPEVGSDGDPDAQAGPSAIRHQQHTTLSRSRPVGNHRRPARRFALTAVSTAPP